LASLGFRPAGRAKRLIPRPFAEPTKANVFAVQLGFHWLSLAFLGFFRAAIIGRPRIGGIAASEQRSGGASGGAIELASILRGKIALAM